MRVLVIGGTGFIGRNVVRHLVRIGHEVAVFHRGSTEAALPAEVQHIHGGRESLDAHLPRFRRFRPDAVVQMVIPSGNDRTARALVETFKGVASRSVVTSSRDVYQAFGRLHRLERGSPDAAPQRTLSEAEWVDAIGREAAWTGSVVAIPAQRLPKHLVRDLDYQNNLALSSRRIRHELGYSEQVPFEKGLRTTLEWERANPPEALPKLFDYEAEDEVLRTGR